MTDAVLQIAKHGSVALHSCTLAGLSAVLYVVLPPAAQTNLGFLSFSLFLLMPVGNAMLVVDLKSLSMCLLHGDWKDECVTLCFLGGKMGSAFPDYS